MKIKILLFVILSLIFANNLYAKCYWLGYGANYKCYDNKGNMYYMFGKKKR